MRVNTLMTDKLILYVSGVMAIFALRWYTGNLSVLLLPADSWDKIKTYIKQTGNDFCSTKCN